MAKKKADIKEKNDGLNDEMPSANLPNTFEMFAKKKNTAFIAMTQEASMKADESNSKRVQKMPDRITSCIHKIRDDK